LSGFKHKKKSFALNAWILSRHWEIKAIVALKGF
jgi:hypothetical protein